MPQHWRKKQKGKNPVVIESKMGGKISLIDETKEVYDYQAIHSLIMRCNDSYDAGIIRELRDLISTNPRCVNQILRKKLVVEARSNENQAMHNAETGNNAESDNDAESDDDNDAESDDDDDDDDDDDAESDDDADYIYGGEKIISPLYLAVERGNTFVVKELLKNGARMDKKCTYSIPSELHLAVQNDDYEMALTLLACGASPSTPDACNSYRPLKVVSSRGIADALIVMGGNVNSRSSVGWTNLHTTPVRDNTDVLKTLVANGANPRARDGDAKTPPCNSAFISYESREFLFEAMVFWKKWNLLRANQLDLSKLSKSSRNRLLALNDTLVPYILEGEKKYKVKETIYFKSIIFDKEWLEYKRLIYPTLILSLQNVLPVSVIRHIFEYCAPNIDGKVDKFWELITNHHEDDDDDDCGWEIPSDAGSENDFIGSKKSDEE